MLFICNLCAGQNNNLHMPLQNPDSVRLELKELFTELGIKHPGFYRYNDKTQFDSYIDSIINTIQYPLNELEILRKSKPIISRIGCLHSGIHLSIETEAKLNEYANCVPFTLIKLNGKFIVWKTFVDGSPLKTGDEITSINGRLIDDIYAELLSNVPMDGYNQTGKYRLLQYTFPAWYRNVIEVADEFQVELANGSKHDLKAVKFDETLQFSEITNTPMSLTIINDIATIKIPSFANSYLKSHEQKFQKEVKSYLKELETLKIKQLIIDVRGNTGGSDSNTAWLASVFFNNSFDYWDRIEITEPVAKDISGLNRMFYGKAKYENGKWLWSDKGLSSKEFKFTQTQKPAKNPFLDQVYILTNGLCMSSCADFVAIMQHNNKAVIIGEETGGGYQGNTSGLIPSEQLESGLIVDVPLLKYVNAVPKEKNYGRGTMPDIEMKPILDEIVDDETFLKRVLEMIKKTKNLKD